MIKPEKNAADLAREHYFRRGPLPAIKGILYTAEEATCFLRAAENARARFPDFPGPECVMVGDSFLTTHMGRQTTKLAPDEQAWFADILKKQTTEVARVLDSVSDLYLIGDMPDGATATPDSATRLASQLVEVGADAIKIEVGGAHDLATLAHLARQGFSVHAHLGYQPQHDGKPSRVGSDLASCLDLFSRARAVRDHGAHGLVLEMVTAEAFAKLAARNPSGLPVFAIFSGRAHHGAQSLNIFDAVVQPQKKRRLFPPTAVLPATDWQRGYTSELIEKCVTRLIEATLKGDYPPQPRARLSEEDRSALTTIDPWYD